MFKFNNEKMTFTNLNEQERLELISVARNIIYNGKIDWDNKFVSSWFEQFKFNENQKLLTISTVFVTRALDSCIV